MDGTERGRAGRGDRDRLQELLGKAHSVLIGPGLDSSTVARLLVRLVAEVAPQCVPVVLDAYALGVVPELAESMTGLAGRVVLTPNHTEAARLLETEVDDDDPVDLARRMARRWRAVVSFQGVVAQPDGAARVVSTGHAGLGTAGSGDVVAGAIAGLLARGVVDPARAACWGTYLHAAAGDRLAARVGRLGFLARELLEEIPLVLTELQA